MTRKGVKSHVAVQAARAKSQSQSRSSKREAAFNKKRSKQSIPKALRRIKANNQDIITYVLDTNVIMAAWESLFKFEEHNVCLVGQVWAELDNHKKGHSSEAFNVRQAIRAVDKLLAGKTAAEIKAGIPLVPPPEHTNGKPHTGKLFFDFSKPTLPEKISTSLDLGSPDDRIILVCLALKEQGKRIVLVSNDGSCRVKASIVGIEAEEYLSDTVVASIRGEEDLFPGFHYMPDNFWDTCESKVVKLHVTKKFTLTHQSLKGVNPNEFLLVPGSEPLRVTSICGPSSVLAETFSHHDVIRDMGIEVRNQEQSFALQLLLDTNLPAVSIAGKAGSGKTYLTLAAGIHLCKKGVYKRIIFTRSTQGSDEDIGFLPGDEEEKITPWMGALWDNIESLTADKKNSSPPQKGVANKKKAEAKFNKDLIQIKSLNFMKGRSITDTLIIVDETQDLTAKKLKMIATRVGEGSKIVFLGNVAQIDNPYLTEHTCGLSVLIRSLRDSSLIGHVTLQNGERGAFADLAEERL